MQVLWPGLGCALKKRGGGSGDPPPWHL